MTKKKKPASEMTDKEIEKRVFPKKVLEELQRVAHEKDDPEDKQDEPSPR